MQYILKQKLLAFGDDYSIKNADGQEVYFVDGRAFSLGNKLSFQDARRNELLFIRQRLLAWGPTYEILQQNNIVATVRKKIFTLFHCRFSVDVPGPNDLEAKGNFLDHEYEFTQSGQTVAHVSKKWISLSDSYAVQIAPDQNDALLLASVIVIDLACHDEESGHR